MASTGSGVRRVKRYRALLARDLSSATCEPLIESLEQVLTQLTLSHTGSIEDAETLLRSEAFDLVLACLDLPPAPSAGVRLASSAIELQPAVVLVTRSLRWLPAHAHRLHRLPWLAPEAGPTEVAATLSALSLTGDVGPAPSLLEPEAASPLHGGRLRVVAG